MRKFLAVLGAAVSLGGANAGHAAWFEARSDHFIVFAEGDAEPARQQAIVLERFDKGMRLIRNMPDDPTAKANPLTVFVVDDLGDIHKLCAGDGTAKAACADVAGFYDGRASGSVAFLPRKMAKGKFELNAQIILFHEYSHHIMYQYFTAAYPAWFVEGFAEFNSTATIQPDGSMRFGAAALHRAYGLVLGGKLPITRLLTASGSQLAPAARELLYGRGWLLCHYLAFSAERAGQLDGYLRKVASGTASLDAARQVFGNLDTLDAELDRYLKAGRMAHVELDAARTPPGTVTVRQLGEGEAAIMPVRLRSDRGVDAKSAATVLKLARELAKPFPDDPAVQNALAEAAFDAGEDAEAAAAADRALAADPKDVAAMLYKGQILMHRARVAKAVDAATWSGVRGWFVKANRLQPEAAHPLALYYISYVAQGVKPTASAVLGLHAAFDRAPQDDGLRFYARQLIRDGALADARAVLAPLAFDPHSGSDNPAAALIAVIDRKDEAALAKMLEPIENGADTAAQRR